MGLPTVDSATVASFAPRCELCPLLFGRRLDIGASFGPTGPMQSLKSERRHGRKISLIPASGTWTGQGAIAAVALLLTGCSGNPSAVLSNVLTTASLPAALPAADSALATQPPTVVYAAIAQKALTCWMGPQGPLKNTYIFHADAASPTTGGQAEIVLQERDTTQKHPWGPRAFRIDLTPEGGGTDTRVSMTNIKLPKDLADAVRTDVIGWAQGSDGCQVQVLRPPAPEPTPAPTAAKNKKNKSG